MATMSLLLFACVTVLGFVFYYFASRYLFTDRERTLHTIVYSAALVVNEDYSSNDGERLTLANIEKYLNVISSTTTTNVFITNTRGEVLISTGGNVQMLSFAIPEQAASTLITGKAYVDRSTLGGIYATPYLTVGIPIIYGNEMIGFAFASSNLEGIMVFMTDVMGMFAFSSIILVMLASMLSVLITQNMTIPLRRMAVAAKSYGQGDLSSRVYVKGIDEIAQLANTFNNMAESLEGIEHSRRQFIDNIAHELRTPMTSIKGFVDGILDGTIPPEHTNRYLQIVSAEVGRLARLTRSMLDITKLEEGSFVANAKPYDVWQTITSVLFSQEKRILEKRIKVEGLAPVKTMIFADPDIVHQVVYNLVDNAIKFTNVGGVMTFNVHKDKGKVYVSVKNTGEGISRVHIQNVFDRFYKEDASRSMDVDGAGLGLYISRKLILQSGGDITVTSVEGEQCEFTFNLPAYVEERQKKSKPNNP